MSECGRRVVSLLGKGASGEGLEGEGLSSLSVVGDERLEAEGQQPLQEQQPHRDSVSNGKTGIGRAAKGAFSFRLCEVRVLFAIVYGKLLGVRSYARRLQLISLAQTLVADIADLNQN